jgi:hypothetical protein
MSASEGGPRGFTLGRRRSAIVHAGLTKARLYDGKYWASYSEQPKGNSPLERVGEMQHEKCTGHSAARIGPDPVARRSMRSSCDELDFPCRSNVGLGVTSFSRLACRFRCSPMNRHSREPSACLKGANIDFCANRGVPTAYACSPVELGQFSSTSFSLAALLNDTLHVCMNATPVESAATDFLIADRYRQVGQCIRSF